jgi:hypothetical protein
MELILTLGRSEFERLVNLEEAVSNQCGDDDHTQYHKVRDVAVIVCAVNPQRLCAVRPFTSELIQIRRVLFPSLNLAPESTH